MVESFAIIFSRIEGLINRQRSFTALFIVIIGVLLTDILFNHIYPSIVIYVDQQFGISINDHQKVDLTFAPEIWGGVLATVLGTLIIVIAIAAESTPKLMDLFVKDWLSLIFIWFLIFASIHAIIIMYYFEPLDRISSVILNTYVYLPLSTILSLPYIFYILLYSKTDNVIKKLYTLNVNNIKRLQKKSVHISMQNTDVVEHYQ